MTEMMKAAVVTEFGKPLEIQEVPIPEPAAGEILVRVQASGVCHTDLHAAEGDWPAKPSPPFIPGHEIAGEVVALGSGVTALSSGDRVGIPWLYSACGHCEYCITGWETLCSEQLNTGYSVNGGFAEYLVAPAAYAAMIPDGLDAAEVAPILCAGVTTYKGLKETEVRPGEWIVISGIGGLGHVAVQYAKAMGMHILAVDVADEKLALAKRLGADLTMNARDENLAERVQQEIGGAHGALVTAVSNSAFRSGVDALRRRGTCALVGLPPGEFPVSIFDVVLKRITIRGSIVGTRADLAEALRFAADGQVKVTFARERLEAINDIFARMRAGAIEGRIVLDFQ